MTDLEKRLLEAVVNADACESIEALRVAVRHERLSPGKVETWEAAYWKLLQARAEHVAAWREAFGTGEEACAVARPLSRRLEEKARAAGLELS